MRQVQLLTLLALPVKLYSELIDLGGCVWQVRRGEVMDKERELQQRSMQIEERRRSLAAEAARMREQVYICCIYMYICIYTYVRAGIYMYTRLFTSTCLISPYEALTYARLTAGAARRWPQGASGCLFKNTCRTCPLIGTSS